VIAGCAKFPTSPYLDGVLTRKIVELTRDWRIRTIVPVIVINLLAFAGLYALMYHYAMSNLVQSQKIAADHLFDDLRLYYEDGTIEHSVTSMAARLQRHTAVHHLQGFRLFGITGEPLIAIEGERPTGNNRVVFERVLDNTGRCRSCHDAVNYPRIAVMQIRFDLTEAMAEARARVQKKFAAAGVAWVGVLVLLFWTGRLVIGRPLARIENSIQPAVRHDLDGLARAHRQREEDIARHMVRADQLAALGEVAAGLTHEIKNPIAGVIAALELLRSETDAAQIPMYDQMLAELRRVTTTLDSLLRLARPRPPQRSNVDLERVVREVASLFNARLRRQGVTLDVEVDEEVPMMSLDSGLIVQLLVNLLTNSMQATDRGGTIRLVLKRGVELSVSDTGRGIGPDDLERIFVPFFTTKEEGTGLGLAICRQIVEQHGGTIDVQSQVGSGTTIVILLPEDEAGHGALAVG
jgi:signal transduction histidine kinase